MVRFGPAGADEEFAQLGLNSIMQVPDYLAKRGLDAFEYSFSHGYRMSTQTAEMAGALFKEKDITLSLHAPYYINFANPDPVMFDKSVGYITTGIKFMRAFGNCDHFCFHSGSCLNQKREDALALVKSRFIECFSRLKDEGALDGLYICPEAMGKPAQIGTYSEVIDLCTVCDRLVPTFDFGHINAITQGGMKTKDDFMRVFELCIEKLGFERTNNCHIHFSKIEYGAKGEIRHLNFEDEKFGPHFEPMIDAIITLGINPRVICESSGMQSRDAATMKNYFYSVKR